jgi:ferritin-like metal-binding protein YciE
MKRGRQRIEKNRKNTSSQAQRIERIITEEAARRRACLPAAALRRSPLPIEGIKHKE